MCGCWDSPALYGFIEENQERERDRERERWGTMMQPGSHSWVGKARKFHQVSTVCILY